MGGDSRPKRRGASIMTWLKRMALAATVANQTAQALQELLQIKG